MISVFHSVYLCFPLFILSLHTLSLFLTPWVHICLSVHQSFESLSVHLSDGCHVPLHMPPHLVSHSLCLGLSICLSLLLTVSLPEKCLQE